MRFLLDTNVCIAFLNGRDPAIRDKLLELDPAGVNLCSIVKAELFHGARNSSRVEANLERLRRFFEPFSSLPFGDLAAEQYGILRTQLRREGRPMGPHDLMIAATALSHDVTLVSRDLSELQRVPGLRVVMW